MYAQSGSDIVCSAVSALTQTALIGLLEVVGAKVDYTIDDDGFIKCRILEESECKLKSADLILRVMYAGLCNIQTNYKEYLGVSEREVTGNV